MEQSFVLKYHGGFTTIEQAFMTAEERKWYIERIVKEIEKQNKSIEDASHKGGIGPQR